MARKEAILSQAPEFFDMRSTKFRDAIIAYDLMTVALSRLRDFRVLSGMLEQSMKFSFNEIHTWTQFAHALAVQGESRRALAVFRELADRNHADAGACLAAARICFEQLRLHEEGLAWARRALKKDTSWQERALRARCLIYIGLGCILLSRSVENHHERQAHLTEAENSLKEAVKADPRDHLASYYLAYYLAQVREIDSALKHVKTALELHPEHQASVHLLILLLSAKNDLEEALEVADWALAEFPDGLQLMSLKVWLEERVNGGEAAILTAKSMLEQLQAFQSDEDSEFTSGFGLTSGSSHDHINGYGSLLRKSHKGQGQGHGHQTNPSVSGFDALSDKDSVSLHAHSVTASNVEKTLSEVASSSLSSPFPTPGPDDPAYAQMRIWLLAAELHLNEDNAAEAELCANEARALAPLSYHVMYVRGLIMQRRDDLEGARQWYENSLGVNPNHVPSLQRLGQVYFALGFDRLAEQSLKVAVRIDPNNEALWTLLGEVKESIARATAEAADELLKGAAVVREDAELRSPTETSRSSLADEACRMFRRASECHSIALGLEASSPILPFTTAPLCFE